MKSKDILTSPDLTDGSKKLLFDYADDAGNWGGRPLVGGNVGDAPADKGHLTDLKRKGLVETDCPDDDGNLWLEFTSKGVEYIQKHHPNPETSKYLNY